MKCKFTITQDNITTYVCNENCFEVFESNPNVFLHIKLLPKRTTRSLSKHVTLNTFSVIEHTNDLQLVSPNNICHSFEKHDSVIKAENFVSCNLCSKYYVSDDSACLTLRFKGETKCFCSTLCLDNFLELQRKIVRCAWCSNEKINFDMVERIDANKETELFCSVECLSLFHDNLQADLQSHSVTGKN
jgi:YHS domain-containing protein